MIDLFPPLAIHIPTFNRPMILRDCIESLMTFLIYPVPPLFFVGNDGDDNLAEVLGPPGYLANVRVLQGPKRGLGANLNMLYRAHEYPLILQLDDDHILKRDLNLKQHAEYLLEHTDAGWIRLMGIGAHNYTARLQGVYWYVRWDSQELYIPSNRPHLKHRRFHEYFGLYPEDVKLWQTEEGFCHLCRDIAEKQAQHSPVAPSVLVPLNSESESAWDHVGASWQDKGY